MPTYQYACTACDHRFEEVQSFSDAALTECPECAGRLRKLYGSVGVVFKGSGFYRTDSRKKSSATDGVAKESSSASGEKSTTSAASSSSSGGSSSGKESNSSSSTTSTTTPTSKAS